MHSFHIHNREHDLCRGGSIILAKKECYADMYFYQLCTYYDDVIVLCGRSNNSVCIYSRKGIEVATISLPGVCTSMDWDKDGDTLAIAQDYNGMVYSSTVYGISVMVWYIAVPCI